MQQQYFGFHAPHSAPNQPDPSSELRQTGSLYDKHIQQTAHSKPALNNDLSQPSSLPTTPTTKSLPRPKSEKNVLSPSIPKYLQQGSGTLRKISSRIDPSQIPRPGKYHKETVFHTRSSSARKNPPSVNSIYVGVDNGNSLPQHLRCTLVAPPSTRDLYKRTELPLCLLATPLACLGTGEEEIATVEMSSPPRCHKCAAYVNPSVQFLDEGRKWVCNLCSNQNTVPDWYYSPLDAAGLRFDRIKRAELCKGSVEFLVGSDYVTVSPSKESRTVIFAVDVSGEAMRRGITAAAIRAVKTAVQQLSQHCQRLNITRSSESLLPAPPQLYQPQANSFTAIEPPSELDYSIGLVGFSSHLHFYDVDLQAHETVKVLSAEADDPFPPLPNHKWFFSLNRQFSELDHLLSGRWLQILEKELEYLPAVPSFQPITSPAAIIAALQTAQPGFGSAKVYLFTSNHSSTGLGHHSSRQRDYLYGYPEEFLMYATPPITSLSSTATPLTAKYLTTPMPSSSSHTSLPWKDVLSQTFEQYKQLGNDCLEKNISISVFFFSPPPSPAQRPGETSHASSDVTLLGEVVKTTGGKLFMLQDPPLNQGNDGARSPPIRSPMVLPSASPLPAPLQLPHLPAFPPFLPSSADVLERQLVHDLVEEWMGSDVVMKLRSSAAVTLHQVISAGQYDSLEEVVRLADIGNTSTVLFDCKVVRDLPDEEKIHFQLATLFTNRQQQRVLRVHNLTLISSNKGNVIFRNCDVEAIAVAVAKMASVRAVSFPLGDEKEGARNFIQTKTIDMLLHYRKLCSSASSPKAQLILPESLKTLPMYCLGMTKHPFLVDNLPVVTARQTHSLSHTSAASPTSPPSSSNILVTVNERFYHLLRLTSSPLRDVLNSVYPRVYSLFAVLESDSFSNYNNTLTGSFDDIAQIPSTDSIDSLNDGADGGSSKLRGLDTHNLSSPNLHSLHINASLSASSSMPPTPSAAMSGGGGISVLTDKLYLDKLKVSQSLNPSSENFESDQIYVIDDRRTLWLYIGRSVPQDLLEELFVTTSPYERSERVQVNVRSRLGRRAEDFLLLLASDGPYQSEIKAIWADSQLTMPSIHRFTSRLIEDANNGMMSYVDYLCNLHARMQGKL